MKTRLLTIALACCLAFPAQVVAQAPKKDDKKAPAPKSPADLAYDEYNKVLREPGSKQGQAGFQKLSAAGVNYLTQFPTHSQVNRVVNELGMFANTSIDSKQPALRTSFLSFLKLEITNAKYKEGVTDAARAALAALDASVANAEVFLSPSGQSLANLREKIDELAAIPGANRFLADRERSYAHLLVLMKQDARAEEQLKKLAKHSDRGVSDMAKQELAVLETKKTPFDLKFTGMDGKPVDFAQYRGKVTALYFWSSTNKGSTDLLEKLRMFHSTYRKRGFELVTVSFDKEEDRAKLEKYLKENKPGVPVYFDGKQQKNEFAPKLNVTGVPRLLLFDQNGTLLQPLQGANLSTNYASNLGLFEAEVKKLLKIK